MKSYTRDTSPEAHRIQVEKIRAMTIAERIQAAFDLSAFAQQAALAVIHRQHPNTNEQEARLILLGRLYGVDLAERARRGIREQQGLQERTTDE